MQSIRQAFFRITAASYRWCGGQRLLSNGGLPIAPNSTEIQVDPQTHTGQSWDEGDYRLARFNVAPKQVNPNFAINLIAKIPPTVVHSRVVSCNGGDGALGHPKVYINLDKPGSHACGYCGLRFVKAGHENEIQHIQV